MTLTEYIPLDVPSLMLGIIVVHLGSVDKFRGMFM